MKQFGCILFLCMPLVIWSQPYRGLKTTKIVATPSAGNAVLRTTPQLVLPPTHSSQTLLQLLARTTPAAGRPRLHKNTVLSAPQHTAWLSNYRKILANFEQLKRQSSSFLFYQSIPLEKHQLSTEETRQWLTKLVPLHSQILKFYLTTNGQDKALQYALDYVEHAISVMDPYLVPTLRLSAQPLIARFNAQDFFLYLPKESPAEDPSLALDGKKIVIINDNASLLTHFSKLYHVGILFPQATLFTYADPMQFLIWFQHTSVKLDIVFTDIQLGDGNGYYVAHRLREWGYNGGIIALTSYAETEENARQLKTAGFDGMVSLDEQYWKMPFPQRVTQAAQVYLERSPNN